MGLTTARLKDLTDKDFHVLYADHEAIWLDMAVNTKDFVIKAVAEENVYRAEDMLEPLVAALLDAVTFLPRRLRRGCHAGPYRPFAQLCRHRIDSGAGNLRSDKDYLYCSFDCGRLDRAVPPTLVLLEVEKTSRPKASSQAKPASNSRRGEILHAKGVPSYSRS